MKYTKIPVDTFKHITLNAGMIVDAFDPATATIGNQLYATTGGTNFSCVPTDEDMGADIDNCPKDTMELRKRKDFAVKMSGTAVTLEKNTAKTFIGSADVSGEKITPRRDLLLTDFKTFWLIADYSDKNGNSNGGFLAIKILNGLSTGGFSIQTGDQKKTNFPFEITGHTSLYAQDVVPCEIYIHEGTEEPETLTVTYNSNGGTGTMTDTNSPYQPGATVTVMSNTFTKAGKTFGAWNTLPDGNGTEYQPAATFTINRNMTLYAIWENEE